MKNICYILVLFCLVFCHCKKYPDGPAITLRSPEKRLIGSWSIKEIAKGSQSMIRDSACICQGSNRGDNGLYFKEDGTVTLHFYFTKDDYFPSSLFKVRCDYCTRYSIGKWKFKNKKKVLELTFVDTLGETYLYYWNIQRLRKENCGMPAYFYKYNKELITSETKNGNDWLFSFEETHDTSCD